MTPSIVSANVAVVRKRFLEIDVDMRDATMLERITEDLLVEQVQSLCEILNDEEILPKENVVRARRLLGAFSAQMSSAEVPKIENPGEWINVLVAKECSEIDNKKEFDLDKETILKTVRLNAFGPDYHLYHKIAECWSSETDTSATAYNRILGVYPASAMINHSCSPNAIRVFGQMPLSSSFSKESSSGIDAVQGREVMIVHSNAAIKKGTEITWAYITPSHPSSARRQLLQTNYGFNCKCTRCVKEEEVLNASLECKELFDLADTLWMARTAGAGQHERGVATMMHLIPSLESTFASTKQISNELQRYLRVGYSNLYMDFFNATLSMESIDSINHVLRLATQLHFSFVMCNNASTEHLSILHLCLDLSNALRNHAMKANGPDGAAKATTVQVRFWTEQLKKAHMVRYGELGGDLETVRGAMVHTKLVLRRQDGWYLTKDRFI